MRRSILIPASLAVTIVIGTAAWAAGGLLREVTGPAGGTLRGTQLYGEGPSASYSGDVGAIGGVSPLRLTFPAGRTYDVLVTVSLDYRTSRGDRFVVDLGVRRDTEFGQRVRVLPARRDLRAAPSGSTATVLFRMLDLKGGREYWFSPSVNVSDRIGDASISSRRVLVVVDATPA
jgi:hypothetical protein